MQHLMAQERVTMQKDVERLQHENSWLAERSVDGGAGSHSSPSLASAAASPIGRGHSPATAAAAPPASLGSQRPPLAVANTSISGDSLADASWRSESPSLGADDDHIDVHTIAESEEELALCFQLLQYNAEVGQYTRRLADCVQETMRFLSMPLNVRALPPPLATLPLWTGWD